MKKKLLACAAWVVVALALAYLVIVNSAPANGAEEAARPDDKAAIKELIRAYREQALRECREKGIWRQYRCI